MSHTPDGHTDDTGHGTHHIFDAKVLKQTFGVLVGLTILTVILALWERGHANVFGFEFHFPALHVGWLSVPIALGIAATKVYWVASRFMGLKYEKSSNVLVFLGSSSFLLVFFFFTYLDFAYRDTFVPATAVASDEVGAAVVESEVRGAELTPPPFVETTGSDLFGAPADAPADGAADGAAADTTATP